MDPVTRAACCSSVIEEKYDQSRSEQKWKQGPIDKNNYFTLINLHSGKLLTGRPDNSFTVKPGVPFDDGTKQFDFSGSLPRGTKVNTYLHRVLA